MKKISTYSAFCLLVVMLLTSCGSKDSFTRRHYNNRYYIGMSKAEKGSKETTTLSEETVAVVEIETIDMNDADDQNIVSDASGKENESVLDSTVQVETHDDLTNTKTENSSLRNRIETLKSEEIPVQRNYGTSFSVREKADQVKQKINPSPSDGDALSLLWIVIVVILILWLLGFALGGLGLGGAIHILLVIALILLILWLLGII